MAEWHEIEPTLRMEEVIDALGISVAQVRGNEYTASCPLPSHSGVDANPSFGINIDKLIYNCFSCGGGNAVRLVQELMGVDYEDALDWLIPFSDADSEEASAFVKQIDGYLQRQTKTAESRKTVLPWFSNSTIEPWLVDLWEIEDWLTDRFITMDVARQLKIGYSCHHFKYGYNGPAVIIPHFVNSGLVGYQERWLDETRPKKIGKYTNSSDFPKKSTLYNFDPALQSKQPVIVVESALTVARLLSAGYQAVATFGASVSDAQIKKLRTFDHVILSYDNDDAGKKAAKRIIDELTDYTYVEIVLPPRGEKTDLGDLNDVDLDNHLSTKIMPAFMYETAP